MPNSSATTRRFSVIVVALLLAGCAVGPDYHVPDLKVDTSFISAGSTATDANSASIDLATFWRSFNDPVLSDLVERGISANFGVRIAQARLQEARSALQRASADEFPEIDLSGSAGRALQPAYLFPGLSRGQRTGNAFDGHFIANWELDFFGRNRRAAESASAQVDASEAGVQAARTVVIAEVARTYMDLRGLQLRYAVAVRSLENQRQTLGLISARLDAGRATRLDVVRASSLYDSTQASLPALQAAIEHDAYRLATLTGQAPRLVSVALLASRPLPVLPVTNLSMLPIGTPEQMLRRRPDILLAERQLASATADIGVATADLFPRISLIGTVGLGSNRTSLLGRRDSEENSYGVGLIWPVLDFGRVRARIDASQAVAARALAVYEQTIATALEETETSLSQFSRSARQAQLLDTASGSAEEAARLSRLRFTAGSVDLLIVLDAERQAQTAQDTLVQAQVSQATALVSVYRSLGGGWDSSSLNAARLR